jgi:hypothetical protein
LAAQNEFLDQLMGKQPLQALLGFGLLVALYYQVFSMFGSNGDSASGYLRAIDAAQGRLMLADWELPIDTFWSSDLLLSAFLIRVFGMGHNVLTLVPSVWWAAVTTLSLVLTTPGLTGAGRRSAVMCTAVLVGLPLLWGSGKLTVICECFIHVGSITYILAGYALLLRYVDQKQLPVLMAFTFVVAFSTIGDPMVYVVGWLPVLAAAVFFLLCSGGADKKQWKVLLATIVGMVAGSVITRLFASWGLKPEPYATEFVEFQNWWKNFAVLVQSAFIYSGGFFFGLPTGKAHLFEFVVHACRLPLLVAFCVAMFSRGKAYLQTLDRGVRRQAIAELPAFWDALLWVAIVINVAAVLTSHGVKDVHSYRYLLPAYIYGSILTARNIDAYALLRPFVPLSLLLTSLYWAVHAGPHLAEPPVIANLEIRHLRSKLLNLGLSEGFAEYWEAFELTAVTEQHLRVRALTGTDKLSAYTWQAKYEWYYPEQWKDRRFFVVSREDPESGSLRESAVRATFGEPVASDAIGPFKIHIYTAPHPALLDFARQSQQRFAERANR